MFFRAAVRKRLQTSTKIVSSGVQILVSKCSRISFCLYPSRNILMKKPEFSAIDLWHRLRPESSCGDLYFLCATHSQPHGVSQSLVQHLSPLMLALGLRFLIWCRTLESVKCVCVSPSTPELSEAKQRNPTLNFSTTTYSPYQSIFFLV